LRDYLVPGSGPLALLGLQTVALSPGERHGGAADERERLAVILGGVCDVAVGGRVWKGVGRRQSAFDGLPHSFYVPRQSVWELRAPQSSGLEVAICSAPARVTYEPYLIEPEHVRVIHVGKRNWQREVRYMLTADLEADRLIVGEPLCFPGNWASSPPHRHERDDPPRETALEEVYLYRFKPQSGFGVQCVYTDDREIDDAYLIRDGDAVAIPRGYHPLAAAPGYTLYYMAILAGDRRMMLQYDDPAHRWLKDAEPLL